MNSQLETVWKKEIEGGGFEFKELKDKIAVVDSLGRLHIVTKQGDIIPIDEDYSSISMMEVFSENIITAHENGEVRLFYGTKTFWRWPQIGEIGESITHIGNVFVDKLVKYKDTISGSEGNDLNPLCEQNKSKSLNKTYFEKNNAADVLSFPLYKNIDSILSLNPENEEDLGDMFINRKIIKKHSQIYGKSFVEELQFIIIHGLLHLVGYSHKNEIKLRKMEDELMKMVWNEY